MTNNVQQGFSLTPQTLSEAQEYAKLLAESDMVPEDFRGKPGNILVAVQMGADVGLSPTQSLQNIAVIQGRPSIWGDALIGVVRASPECEYIQETVHKDEKGEPDHAVCIVKRRGEPETARTFSKADANQAGLWGKKGPWQSYPGRMLQMRARSFALRDVFPDLLKGLSVAEEVKDIPPEKDVTPTAPTTSPEDTVAQLNQQINGNRETTEPSQDEAQVAGRNPIDRLFDRIDAAATLQELNQAAPTETDRASLSDGDLQTVRQHWSDRRKQLQTEEST